MTTLHIDHTSRWFGNVVAVNDITMDIGPGVTGLLGPNGAGKSTLINMMAGFLPPSTGTVTLDKAPIWRNRKAYQEIGLVPEREGMYDYLTGWEFVLANAQLHKLSDPKAAARRALATVEMEKAQDRRISTYSKGMRQRMQLMRLLREMGDAGRTVLFSSHILEEVEQLASHIEVIVAGRHAASGDFRKIRRLMTDRPHRYLVRSSDDRRLAAALIADASTAGIQLDWDEQALRIQAIDFGRFTEVLPRLAREHGIRLLTVSPSDESLESVFSYLVAA